MTVNVTLIEKALAYSELEKKANEIKELKTQISVEKENAANVKKELEEGEGYSSEQRLSF